MSNSSRTWVPAASVTSNFVLFLREILSKLRVEVQFDLRVTQLTEVVVGPKVWVGAGLGVCVWGCCVFGLLGCRAGC